MSSLFAGVDVGSSLTKAVVLDGEGRVQGAASRPTAMNFGAAAKEVIESACSEAGIQVLELERVFSTGYGRKNVKEATGHKTEIACHGKGVYHWFRRAMTVVDIGGQDNKIIRLGEDGRRLDFNMNRKCAAGTGAFLEEMARRIGVPLEDLEEVARGSEKRLELGSFCTVFSGTELLSLARKGERVEDMAMAVFRSLVRRVSEMGPLEGEIALTGGVVHHNPLAAELLSEITEAKVYVPQQPLYVGALGAALYSLESTSAALDMLLL